MIRMNLQNLLDQRGETVYWLSRQAGITYPNMSHLVKGNAKGIRLQTIEVLCQVLECTPNDLFVIDFDQPEDA